MEEVQWNSIDKKQNGLKYSKNGKSSTLPRRIHIFPLLAVSCFMHDTYISIINCQLLHAGYTHFHYYLSAAKS